MPRWVITSVQGEVGEVVLQEGRRTFRTNGALTQGLEGVSSSGCHGVHDDSAGCTPFLKYPLLLTGCLSLSSRRNLPDPEFTQESTNDTLNMGLPHQAPEQSTRGLRADRFPFSSDTARGSLVIPPVRCTADDGDTLCVAPDYFMMCDRHPNSSCHMQPLALRPRVHMIPDAGVNNNGPWGCQQTMYETPWPVAEKCVHDCRKCTPSSSYTIH